MIFVPLKQEMTRTPQKLPDMRVGQFLLFIGPSHLLLGLVRSEF